MWGAQNKFERDVVVDVDNVIDMFPGAKVVVDRVNPVEHRELVVVIGRDDNVSVWNNMLVEAGFDLGDVVDMDGWDDTTVSDETGHVLWVCDDVVSPLEWGRLQVYTDRWFVMKVPSVETMRVQRLQRQTRNSLLQWQFLLVECFDTMWQLDRSCVQCGGQFFEYDRRGLGWCEQHWDGGFR